MQKQTQKTKPPKNRTRLTTPSMVKDLIVERKFRKANSYPNEHEHGKVEGYSPKVDQEK
jgi:hypothetical protein